MKQSCHSCLFLEDAFDEHYVIHHVPPANEVEKEIFEKELDKECLSFYLSSEEYQEHLFKLFILEEKKLLLDRLDRLLEQKT